MRCGYSSPFDFHYYGVCRACRSACEHKTAVTGYSIKANGTEARHRICLECGARDHGGEQVGPVFDVLLLDRRDGRPCERCGDTASGVELHHYAPRNTFRDADEWATGWLCVPCHREWHTSMDGYRWHARAKHAQ